MAIFNSEFVFLRTDRWFKVLRNERSPSVRKNLLHNPGWRHKRRKLFTMYALPGPAELFEKDTIIMPLGQFFAVIVPTFSSHCSGWIDMLKKLINVCLHMPWLWIAGIEMNSLSVEII